MRKKILFLGGSPYQTPPIKYAKQQGHYIITCDYLPDNPGHKLADEYHNVSTIDQDAVLELATRLKIDAVVAFGSDPAAPTAAYVAEKLNLPGNPRESVEILTRKDLFRDFLLKHNFEVPWHRSFSFYPEVEAYFKSVNAPAVIKPVDSSGSKGVSKVSCLEQLLPAFNSAISYSRVKKVIVEEYIDKDIQIAGDGFVLNGKLVFRCFGKEHFDLAGNPFAPVGESFPLQRSLAIQDKAHNEIERLMQLLNMKAGELNFDMMIDKNDRLFLMEIAPRGGGNLISEIIRYSTGIDMAKYVVDCALGLDCGDLCMYREAKYYSCYTLHSQNEGYFKDVIIDESVRQNIVEQLLFIKPGDWVKSFENLGSSLGELILKYDSAEEMIEKMDSMSDRVRVVLHQ
ncbi:MAG: putative carbamoyl-phosphate-synthetase [Mucilaginibacter sp.]|nr:putative carbamoyl-phosphate-synthetase [Mucilaginibacter sp.]